MRKKVFVNFDTLVKQNIRSGTKQFGSYEVKEFTCEISDETDQNS